MSFPIIVMFNNRVDEISSQFLKELIPDLASIGYDTVCVNTQSDKSVDTCFELAMEFWKHTKDEFFKKNHVSESNLQDQRIFMYSNTYESAVRLIEESARTTQQYDVIKVAKKYFTTIKGVDFDWSSSLRYQQNPDKTYLLPERINTILRNLLELDRHNKGILFFSEFSLRSPLIAKFKENGLLDRVVFCFSNSLTSKENLNEIQLKKKFILPSDPKDMPFFKETILGEIFVKSKKEDLDNSHLKYLKNKFGCDFKTFFSSDYYLDALTEPNVGLEKYFQKLKIITKKIIIDQKIFLIISNINTREVATKLGNLPDDDSI